MRYFDLIPTSLVVLVCPFHIHILLMHVRFDFVPTRRYSRGLCRLLPCVCVVHFSFTSRSYRRLYTIFRLWRWVALLDFFLRPPESAQSKSCLWTKDNKSKRISKSDVCGGGSVSNEWATIRKVHDGTINFSKYSNSRWPQIDFVLHVVFQHTHRHTATKCKAILNIKVTKCAFLHFIHRLK